MTSKQIKDLETIDYFIPEIYKDFIYLNQDCIDFLGQSDRGLIPEYIVKREKNNELYMNWGYRLKWYKKLLKFFLQFFRKEFRNLKRDETLYGYDVLKEGKRWRGIHMEMFEEGVLDSSMPYYCILGCGNYGPKVPILVKDFMKKAMFKGTDAEIIENCYNEMD